MRARIIIKLLFIFTFTYFPLYSQEYAVVFDGVPSQKLLDLLHTSSTLIELQDRPFSTQAGLKRRIESDLPNLYDALQSEGYYAPTIEYRIENNAVLFTIDVGPKFTFQAFHLIGEVPDSPYDLLTQYEGKVAYPKTTWSVEQTLLQYYVDLGYPWIRLQDRQVIADLGNHTVTVMYHIETGPLTRFGPTKIFGLCHVKESVVLNQICWKERDLYNPAQLEKTQKNLEDTTLFTSVSVSRGKTDTVTRLIPVEIHVEEGKRRSIGAGISYSTQRGAGAGIEWVNRNFSGRGDRLGILGNFLHLEKEASLFYSVPHFLQPNQKGLFSVEWQEDETDAYREKSVTFRSILEQTLSPSLWTSYGLENKILSVTDSLNNGDFTLIKFPFCLRNFTSPDPLDPISGSLFKLELTPTYQIRSPCFSYTTAKITAAHYKTLGHSGRFTLATKAVLGAILGSDRALIPLSERFYAGSEDTLRGYHYRTVGPVGADGQPNGGRSIFIATAEGRWRFNEEWGGVLFCDVGNVYKNSFPRFDKKVRKSVGGGLRYFTQVGPIRIDVAFPLDRTKFDSFAEFYLSVGQTF